PAASSCDVVRLYARRGMGVSPRRVFQSWVMLPSASYQFTPSVKLGALSLLFQIITANPCPSASAKIGSLGAGRVRFVYCARLTPVVAGLSVASFAACAAVMTPSPV